MPVIFKNDLHLVDDHHGAPCSGRGGPAGHLQGVFFEAQVKRISCTNLIWNVNTFDLDDGFSYRTSFLHSHRNDKGGEVLKTDAAFCDAFRVTRRNSGPLSRFNCCFTLTGSNLEWKVFVVSSASSFSRNTKSFLLASTYSRNYSKIRKKIRGARFPLEME